MKKILKNKKGITLVALVITVIILLILAGISIASLTNSGLFNNAKLSKEKSDEAQEKEDEILADYKNKIGEYVDSNRDTVAISKEEYEELVNKVNNIGQTYSKRNTITISSQSTWTNVTNATWTIPAGTWIIDFNFNDSNDGTGIWAFELKGLGVLDSMWKSDANYCTKYFTCIRTFTEEKTGYFSYYQSISAMSRDIIFTMNAVRIK